MRVESSVISYQATHRLESYTAVREETVARAANVPRDTVRISQAAQAAAASEERKDLEGLDARERLTALTVEALLGGRIDWRRGAGPRAEAASSQPAAAAAPARRRTEIHAETEHTSFRAQGVVELADGRSVSFAATLTLDREFYSATSTIIGAGKATDPLVVNFGGAPARLSAGKIDFDLNSDGTSDRISFVADGSGFLALDANEDGKVNDGSELFGPRTGDGFAELSEYDSDANGWIDEGDAVFAKLRLWTRDGLSTLAQAGVGAISVSSAETPFELKDSRNVSHGQVRATGVYLSEAGSVGTVQQVDLATG